MTNSWPTRYHLLLFSPVQDELLYTWTRWRSLKFSRIVNGVGGFTLQVPVSDCPLDLLRKDSRFVIFERTDDISAPRPIFGGLLLYWKPRYERGVNTMTLAGPDYNSLLDDRIIAYYAMSSQSFKADYADDMLKEIVRENLLSDAVDTSRDMSSWGVTCAPDVSLGPSIEMGFSWQKVLATAKKISERSRQSSIEDRVCWNMEPIGSGWEIEFQTKLGMWGNDHRWPDGGNGPVLFSIDRRNAAVLEWEYDALDASTYIYAGGQGQEEDRKIIEVEDADEIIASPFGRRERFYDGRAYDDPVALTSEAYAELDDSRTKKRMVLEPSDVEGCRFGVHYGFGDVVSAEYLNMLSNYEIAALTISTNGATWRRQISLEEYV